MSKPCSKKKAVGNSKSSGAIKKPGGNGAEVVCSHRTPRQLHASTYIRKHQ